MGCGSSSEVEQNAPKKRIQVLPKENKVNWAAFEKQLPPLDSSSASKEARKKLFDNFDVNGNGFISLAELDKV